MMNKVREFNLVNEKGQIFSLMDIENYTLLTDPDGLGYSYSNSYTKVGDVFVNNLSEQEQTQITGICNFLFYDNYTNLVNFIENSQQLKLNYKIPLRNGSQNEYFKNVKIQSLGKTEKDTNGILSCPIILDMTSLWYEQKEYTYDMSAGSNEVRWNFKWGARFANYNSRKLEFNNTGHTLAPIYLEIDGAVKNPEIIVTDSNNNILFNLLIEIEIDQYEKFIYSSIDGDIKIMKQNVDGTYESLFKQAYINIENNNIYKLPLGTSNITIQADNEITSARLNIYPYYRSI